MVCCANLIDKIVYANSGIRAPKVLLSYLMALSFVKIRQLFHIDSKGFTMVYYIQNYWVLALFPSGNRKPDVSETGSISILRCGAKTPEDGNRSTFEDVEFSSS
jgi:hypothetical protein